ncbi:MAG: hypothetical protein HYS43_00745 [Candidatus Liptonbacteria bacterium]|nr:hypothetical protein [Candidatus Liptonbacteria bacterium]
MEKPTNVVNLAEKRREKESKKRAKRTAAGVTPEGAFIFPEAPLGITEGEALGLANEVIEKYSAPEALLEDFSRRENAEIQRLGHGAVTDEKMKKGMEADLASQRSVATHMTTKELLKIFDLHKKHPAHFYGTKILACAEALADRFGPTAA